MVRMPHGLRWTGAHRGARLVRAGTARPLRVLRRLEGAARAHHAPLARVALRAFRLTRRGWHMGDLALLGLLDPHGGPARERWAVRRGEFERLQESLNPGEAVPLVQDKLIFAEACLERDLPTVPVLWVLERSSDPSATARAWALGLERHAPEEFVVKPISGQRGIGVRVLRRGPSGAEDHCGAAWSWYEIARELVAGPGTALLLQPRLHQHPDVRRLSGRDALQTYRIITLLDEDGRAGVIYALMRLAVGDGLLDGFRSADSGTTGNLIVRVEPDGTLATPVAASPSGFGLERVPRHPHSGVVLSGADAPGWVEARALALRAAEAFAPLRAVGWDIAATRDGAVLVEGNAWWGASADPDGALLPALQSLREAVAGSNPPGRG